MPRRTARRVLGAATGIGLLAAGLPAAAAVGSPAPTGTRGPTSAVIIVLRDQFAGLPATPGRVQARIGRVDGSQASVIGALHRADVTHVRRLHVVNALGARVSAAEAARLRRDPAVAEVVPDALLTGPRPARVALPGDVTAHAALVPGLCPRAGSTQLEPEGVSLVHAVSGDPHVRTARQLGLNGLGVTIGNISTGLQPNEQELIRPDGSRVVADYRDFTGEGTAAQGYVDAEGYLDTSIIAAQARRTYDLSRYAGLPRGCNIRVEGAAPGVSIDEYKVYGTRVQTTTSAFLAAIDWAVDRDHVDVLNEEAGSFPMPDTSQDLIKAANAAAVAAGVTVTSPTYDAGPQNTIWSPSSQPGVISVGASTAYQTYAQTGRNLYAAIGARGWRSNNVSALSSGGTTQGYSTLNVIAPGDLDWIACYPAAQACQGSALAISGGTSESGPLVAAACALVIQAYRRAHPGRSPSPEFVGDVIASTADDLTAPSDEQGSGLLDAYRAALAALTVSHPRTRLAEPPTLVASAQQFSASGKPGTSFTRRMTVRNDGTRPARVYFRGRGFGGLHTVTFRTLSFDRTNSTHTIHFNLRADTDRLTVDIGNPGGTNPNLGPLSVALKEPDGKLVAYSFPQGPGNHGHVSVHNAQRGEWTALVTSRTGPQLYRGVAYVRVGTYASDDYGSVSPSQLTLAAGATGTVTLRGRLPSAPGDTSAALIINAPGARRSSLPITTRAAIVPTNGVGHFSGVLQGGNGRAYAPAQSMFYALDVPGGAADLDVSTALTNGDLDPYFVYLIDPHGNTVAMASNRIPIGGTETIPVTATTTGAQLHTLDPPGGRWSVLVTFTNPVVGNRLLAGLVGTVSTAPQPVSADGLPGPGTAWTAGSTHVVGVRVRNTGSAPQAYFLDGRLVGSQAIALNPITAATSLPMPRPVTATVPQWVVPTNTTALTATATSTAPTTFDLSPLNGEPDIGATVSGNTAQATITGSPVTQGDWQVTPQLIGSFGTGGATGSSTTLGLVAQTRPFDDTLTAGTGDLFDQGAGRPDYHPVVVQPGATVTLDAVITPSAADAGQHVQGTLFVDTANAVSNNGASPSANQVAALPYEYDATNP